ncbi:MAG TPA: phospholipase D-like domain-containing protein [Pseudonocardiaceae bacterium]|jgi:hypothetical protein
MLRTRTRRLGLSVLAGAATIAASLTPVLAHAAGTYTLQILPDQGESAIYNFVNTAKSSIDVTMYELRDTTMTTDLVNREKAGVNVRVILDNAQKSVDQAAYTALTSGGVGVTWSSTSFVYTHQKTITVDNAESYISTGNLDTTYYSTSRDYGVYDTDSADVSAVVSVFNADYAKTTITPTDGDDLVWSPTDSQSHLLSLINGAQHTLDVQEEEFGDTALVNAIVADANRGVTVRVVAENESSSYTTELNEVTAAGGKVTTYTSSTGFYIHAKDIVADYGTSTAKVFLGSENFSDNSLNHNRELGLIINDANVMSGVEATFTADFNKTPSGGGGAVTVSNPGNQTSTVGTATSVQVSASDTAGGNLSYSATGLPNGLSINASSGLISGTPTATGTSNVTVTATDSTGPTGSTSFSWTVNTGGGGGGCTSAQLLGNPGFETGTAAPWTVSASVIADNSKEPPHGGTWDAWLDGYGKATTDTLSQTVTLPTGCSSYQLSYWLHIDTAETGTKAYDTFNVQVLSGTGAVLSTVATYSNANHNTGYTQHTASLAAYAGQTITVQFTGTEDYELQTSFVVDDTAINVS